MALTRVRSPILTYHSIDNSGSTISVPPVQFEKQMAYLHRKAYRSVTLSEMVRKVLSGATCSERTVVLTFDDGFRNVAEVARPILQRYGFSATIFVATNYVGNNCGWMTERPVCELPVMTWSEIEDMHGSNFDIQPHSRSHPFLTRLADDEAFDEIASGKQELETRLNKVCDVFCYPHGDYDDRIVALLKKAGFLGAVTIDFGRRNSADDLYRLKRLGSAHFARSQLRFRASLTGHYELCLGIKHSSTNLLRRRR
jgi:peptidoglycan/xylan/chitin deacetylase (PgdA/CDA1 family)